MVGLKWEQSLTKYQVTDRSFSPSASVCAEVLDLNTSVIIDCCRMIMPTVSAWLNVSEFW